MCREHEAQLRRRQSDWDAFDTRIHLVTFGTKVQALDFQSQTQTPFPILLDPHRRVYRDYGLGMAYAKVVSAPVLRFYWRAARAGQSMPRKVIGNPFQLGGDFLIDSRRRIVLAHPSRNPADRPSPAAILDRLRSR